LATVRIMAPQLVAPYRLGGKHVKNDAADAAAICEAVTRPQMRFVPIKTIEHQAKLFVHCARQGYVSERTALINRIRGLLGELGIILPQSQQAFKRGVHQVLEDLPGYCNLVIAELLGQLRLWKNASRVPIRRSGQMARRRAESRARATLHSRMSACPIAHLGPRHIARLPFTCPPRCAREISRVEVPRTTPSIWSDSPTQ